MVDRNDLAIRTHNRIFEYLNKQYRYRTFENYVTEFSCPAFEERYSVLEHCAVFTEFYGPLSFPLTDIRQTTLARLTDSEMLTGLRSVLKRDVPLSALLPTFVGMSRLCRSLGIKFIVERDRIAQCLSCLAQRCNCVDFTFRHVPCLGCVCGDLLCSCDYLPPPLLFLDELSEVFFKRAPDAYWFTRAALSDEDVNDVHTVEIGIVFIGPAMLFLGRWNYVMPVRIYEPSNFQPP